MESGGGQAAATRGGVRARKVTARARAAEHTVHADEEQDDEKKRSAEAAKEDEGRAASATTEARLSMSTGAIVHVETR